MKKIVGTIALLAICLGSPAVAADLARPAPAPVYPKAPPIAPVFSWTGFYIGATAGGHWDTDQVTGAGNPAGFVPVGVNVPLFNNALGTSLNPRGFIGGGEIGYNWQTANFVLGFEGDVNGLTGSATRTVTGLTAAGLAAADFVTDSAQATFLATFRGRLGVAFDRALFYATGGGAWGSIKTTDTDGFFGGTVVDTTSNTTTKFGWTVGGGLEYAFTDNLSFKAEYLFVNLGNFNETIAAAAGAPNTTVTINHSYTENLARVGLNYRFGGPVVARY